MVTLDTHEIVKELTSAGFSEAQAEALTRAVRRGAEIDLSHLATKADFAALQADFASLQAGTKADIAELKYELTWRVFGMPIGVTALMNGILFALIGLVR